MSYGEDMAFDAMCETVGEEAAEASFEAAKGALAYDMLRMMHAEYLRAIELGCDDRETLERVMSAIERGLESRP